MIKGPYQKGAFFSFSNFVPFLGSLDFPRILDQGILGTNKGPC